MPPQELVVTLMAGLGLGLAVIALWFVVAMIATRPIRRETGYREVVPRSFKLQCTYCGGEDFYSGPQGGMMTNICCANRSCRHWFNVCPELGIFDDLHSQAVE